MEKVIKKPSKLLLYTEAIRSFFETIRGFIFLLLSASSAEGNGRVVMVVPGLLTSDFWTIILRKFLEKKGFIVYGWQMGINLGKMEKLPELGSKLAFIKEKHNQKVILIGWSMGGLFSRELCHQRPDLIAKVVTIGSPFGDVLVPNNAKWVFDLLNTDDVDHTLVKRLASKTTMPSMAIFSKMDGIVPWEACRDKETDEDSINLEVSSSHFGMGANPNVLKAILASIK